jgi:hypothetical protein
MISWTIPGTVQGLTGSSSSSSSSEASGSWQVTGTFFDYSESANFTQTGSTNASGETILGGSGATTKTHISSSFSSSSIGILTYNVAEEPTTVSGSESMSLSSSSSGETTSVFTAQAQTSTTITFESGYNQTGTTEAPTTFFTTEKEEDDKIEFVGVETTTTVTIGAVSSTRQGTSTLSTDLQETVTLSGLADTVIQAFPGEIIYVISNVPTAWGGYSAASDLAESGTRFTLKPSISTVAREPIATTAPTSSTVRPSFSTGATYSVTTNSLITTTSASYFSFPPLTATLAFNSYSLQSSSASNSIASGAEVFGGGTANRTTINQTEYIAIVTTARRQTQSETYSGLTTTTHSRQRPVTVSAAGTFSISSASSRTFPAGFGLNTGVGEESNGSGRTVHAEGNTTISVARAELGQAGAFGRTKYRTTGAVEGTQTGGWITANATSSGFPFPFYVTDGSGRNGLTVFPQTNNARTVNGNSVTWSTSTMGAEGTESTTTSAEFGVAGQPLTITDVRPLTNFGGRPGRGCTFVERPLDGVYKDIIGGQTSSFGQSDIAISEGESRALRVWRPVRAIGPLQLSNNLNPISWSENRNSNNLPPNLSFANIDFG